MKLSLILPIYNVEKYLPRCLDSIYAQKVQESDFEVICVIDGSPDNSAEVVRLYQEKYSNIKCVIQENGGVSSARNKGISIAEGQYVTFVDPDDVLYESSLQRCIECLNENDGEDIIIVQATLEDGQIYPREGLLTDSARYTPKELLDLGHLRACVWGALYRLEFLKNNNLRFPVGVRNGEDSAFFLFCLYFCNYVLYKEILSYKFVGMDGSATKSYSQQRIKAMIESVKILNDIMVDFPSLNEKNFIKQYVNYSCLSNLVLDVFLTEGVGYNEIKKSGVAKYARFEIDDNITFLRDKMKMMNFSFTLFYFLSWLKHVVLAK